MELLSQLVELAEVALLEVAHLLGHALIVVDELVHWDQRPVVGA